MSPHELESLSAVAKALNQESDDVNKVILALNEKLSAMNLGITLYLPYDHGCSIGFDKIDVDQKSAWQLCWKDETWRDSVGVQALLKAPRDIRIQAVKNIGHLITALHGEAQSRIESIQYAKELIKEL